MPAQGKANQESFTFSHPTDGAYVLSRCRSRRRVEFDPRFNSSLRSLLELFADPEHHQAFLGNGRRVGSAISAVVIISAVLVARSQLREAQRLRADQVRPFVVIEFRPEATSVINLRISNLGSTMARNVQFVVRPPLVTTRGDQRNIMDMQIFKSGIKSLAPGRVIQFFFDTWIGHDKVPLPSRCCGKERAQASGEEGRGKAV